MNQKDSIWNKVSAPAVLVVLTALFTGLFIAPSFESARPRSLTLGYDPVRSAGRANGLITFDPLEQAYGEVEQLYKDLGSKKDPPWRVSDAEQCSRFSLEALARGLTDGEKPVESVDAREKMLVLLESVRGGALSEDHERRLRGRYATAAAFARERIYPAQSKRLNLLWFEDTAKDQSAPECAFADSLVGGVLVPYEFLERGAASHSPYSRVVVCWIDEAAIERNPLEFGLQFERRVRDAVAAAAGADVEKRVDVRWLGPTTSGGLKTMMRGLAATEDARKAARLKIVTPYATSPLLKLSDECKWGQEGFSLVRAVNTDDVLARLLLNELVLRVPALMPLHHPADATAEQASPSWTRTLAAPLRRIGFVPPPKSEQRVRVALITELDSTYGQAWIQNMNGARHDLAGTSDAPGPHPQLASVEFTVFPVFGWVDGVVRESSDKRDSSAATSVARDYPAEAHQLDYLHRLRDDLQSAGAFSAIAIFVTEEYDTMMILESLRPQFPGAMFLTTDLDARYLHPRHAPFTRNLVVASHFGLTPQAGPSDSKVGEDGVLRAAPEFRDGYQTAVWHAVRALANNVEPKPPVTDSVYEIGRSRVVALNAQAGSKVDAESGVEVVPVVHDSSSPSRSDVIASALRAWTERFSVNAADSSAPTGESSRLNAAPVPTAPSWGVYLWALASGAALLVGLLVFGTRTGRGNSGRWRADSKALFAFGLIAVVALASALFAVIVESTQQQFPAEPMALFEGVSAWPTIALRGLMMLVCLFAFVSIPQSLRRAQSRIAAQYGLDERAEPVHIAWVLDWAFIDEATSKPEGSVSKSRVLRALSWLRRGVGGVLQALGCVLGVKAPPTLVAKPLAQVWAFVRRGVDRPHWTWLRMLALGCALYVGIAPFFILAGPPPNPVRGEFAYLLERISLFVSVFSFLMLMMLVMETSFFASRLVGQIVNPEAVILPDAFRPLELDRKERLALAQQIARIVDPLVWSPMLVLGLMIVSRASVFDAWPWPSILIGVFSVFLVMLLMCIVNLRRQCKRARDAALSDLVRANHAAELDEPAKRRLSSIRAEIEALAGGAFSPLLQHPILRALSLPLTAFGANLAFERNLLERFLGAF